MNCYVTIMPAMVGCNQGIHLYAGVIQGRELYDYIRAEYRQIAIIVGSTTIGRVGILSV